MLEYSSIQRTSRPHSLGNAVALTLAAHRSNLIHRLVLFAEAGERQAAGSSFLSATAYGVGGMIEDYLRRRLEEIMTVLLNPDRGPHSPWVADARALLAAKDGPDERPVRPAGDTTDRVTA